MCKSCDEECTCHITPPCSYCITHRYCDICGDVSCLSKMTVVMNQSDGDQKQICEDCMED
jgi:hypothetical protein